MEQHAFRAMGSQMMAGIDAGGSQVGAHLAAVPGWFAGWEAHLSRFQPDSELSSAPK